MKKRSSAKRTNSKSGSPLNAKALATIAAINALPPVPEPDTRPTGMHIDPGDNLDIRPATTMEALTAITYWREKLALEIETDERSWWASAIGDRAIYTLLRVAETTPKRMTTYERCASVGLIKLAVDGRGHAMDSEVDLSAFRRLSDERAEAQRQADAGPLFFAGTVALMIWDADVADRAKDRLRGITDAMLHTLAGATLEAFGLSVLPYQRGSLEGERT